MRRLRANSFAPLTPIPHNLLIPASLSEKCAKSSLAADVQLVHVEHRREPLHRLTRDGRPRIAELAQRGRRHKLDQQAQDGDDDQEL